MIQGDMFSIFPAIEGFLQKQPLQDRLIMASSCFAKLTMLSPKMHGTTHTQSRSSTQYPKIQDRDLATRSAAGTGPRCRHG